MRLRREVEIPDHPWPSRLAALVIGFAIGCLAVAGAGCGRGGPPPCFPQPAATSGGSIGGGTVHCEVKR